MTKVTIADLEKRKAQLDAKIRQLKAKEAEQKRKEEMRVKSIFGAYMLHRLEGQSAESIHEQLNRMQPFLTNEKDKTLVESYMKETILKQGDSDASSS